jgi:hypothetical protein
MPMRRVLLACVVLLTLFVPLLAASTVQGAEPGTRLWVRRYPVTAGDARWTYASKGPGGSVYVAGQSDGGTAVVIAKYSAAGVLLWSASSDPSWSRATAAGIEVDGAGNCFVAGTYETEPDAASHIFLAKFPAAGPGVGSAPLWQKAYDGPGAGDDAAGDVTRDRAGGVYVCGSRSSVGGGGNAVVVKYSASDGSQLWVAAYTNRAASPPDDSDWATAVIAARNGVCYFAGDSQESADVLGGFVVRIDPDGTRAWAQRLPHVRASAQDTVSSLAFAPGGGAVVAGSARPAKRGGDVLVGRFWPDGTAAWVRAIDAGGSESGLALRLDDFGNVLVAGDSVSSTVRRGLLVKLRLGTGGLKWRRLYRPAGTSASQFSALAVDGSRNAYCGGFSGSRFAVVKYSRMGEKLWRSGYGGPAPGARCTALVYVGGTKRALYAAGGSNGVETGADAVLTKFAP